MGEYAEMMLNGTCCEACGEYIGEGDGTPRYCCEECAESRGGTYHAARKRSRPKRRRSRSRSKNSSDAVQP